MKNFILFLLCAVCCVGAFCAPDKSASSNGNSGFDLMEFYSSATAILPKNYDGDLGPDSAFLFSYGVKFRCGAVEARYFNSCNKTTGLQLHQIKDLDSYRDVFCKSRYSLLLDLKKFDERCDAKIAFGAIDTYSWMTNPVFSTAFSPFVYPLSDAETMSPSFPTKSSTKREDSIFAGANFHFVEGASSENVRILPLHLELFYIENKNDKKKSPYVCGLNVGFLYKNYLKVTSGFKFARWYCAQYASADVDWWNEIPVWNSSLFNSFMNETTVAIPYFKNKIVFGITENAQSPGRYWLRDEAVFKMGSFALSASAFVSDSVFLGEKNPLVTMGGVKKYSLWQIKLVPELCVFLQQGATLKFGAAGFLEEKVVDYEKKNEHASCDAKISTGIKYSGKKDSLKIIVAVSDINISRSPMPAKEADLPKFSGNLSYSHKFKNKNSIALFAAASFQPNCDSEKNEYIESLRVCFYPGADAVKSVSLGLSATQKKSGNKIQPFAKASFLFKLKKVRINANICVNSNFAFSE